MRNPIRFDPGALESLISEFGVRGAWLNLLASHVKAQGPSFHYILESQEFVEFSPIMGNPLANLSIGEIGLLYEYSVAMNNPDARKDNGQYFTPDDVSELMVKQALTMPSGKWLDPCSGIGNLSWHLVNAQPDKEAFLRESLILSDRDGLALLIARVLFTISFQKNRKHLFHEIQSSFIEFDFLSVASSGLDIFEADALSAIPSHDFVIVNPPYRGLRSEDTRFETSKAKDLYAYFLENVIKTSKGFVSITPQSFTNASKFASLRAMLLEKFETIKIYAFDNIPGNVFFGIKYGSSNSNSANSIRAAITFAYVGRGTTSITSLLRWRTSERVQLFKSLDRFLCEIELKREYFPKVSRIWKDLYEETRSMPTLSTIISQTPTEYVLHIPAAPRYFISALKKPVSRASIKTIYFRNLESLNMAYMVINSSLMYWWWRVRDGGMTLSLETIRSVPLPVFRADPGLIADLEKSEMTNRVSKLNAGSHHENVKHNSELVLALNMAIVPGYGEKLCQTHENSELVQLSPKDFLKS